MTPDLSQLFSVSQAAKACGISRSTLLRMEARGLLVPAYVSPKAAAAITITIIYYPA